MYLNVCGVQVEIIKKRVKSLRLKVYAPDGRVRLVAPLYMPDDKIEKFLFEHAEWIKKHREKYEARAEYTPTLFITGEKLMLLGSVVQLKVITAKSRSAEFCGGEVVLYVREGDDEKSKLKLLDKFYKEVLTRIVDERLPVLEAQTGLNCNGYKVKKMKAKWGYCNTETKELCFNSELAKKNYDCIDYVIIHELVHTVIKNHDFAFKAKMSRLCPDWKTVKQILNA